MVITVTKDHIVMRSRNLPNHPTAIAMDAKNPNGALPMGPIGAATNGVVFLGI